MACVTLLPAIAHAQASLAGVVRDSSGAVLPGVTVEAASGVLIETVRTSVTDGTGQYRIPELPAGTYTVTFTLPGFSTIQRQEVAVGGVGVITINADMRVGSLQETIIRLGGTRTLVGFDLYNLFNSNPGLTYNQAFGPNYLRPTSILMPRFIRFNATVDF